MKLIKPTNKQLGGIGVILMMIATAYIIPFPTELLTFFISKYILGGVTVANIEISVAYLWIAGIVVFACGYMFYLRSGNHITLRKNHEKKK
ncbi:hypothetical protein KAU33_08800 [Candidatus Dependentiae bacterium]|nr:hypothetical protein [Candidatus Dependentiae bacterium]